MYPYSDAESMRQAAAVKMETVDTEGVYVYARNGDKVAMPLGAVPFSRREREVAENSN